MFQLNNKQSKMAKKNMANNTSDKFNYTNIDQTEILSEEENSAIDQWLEHNLAHNWDNDDFSEHLLAAG